MNVDWNTKRCAWRGNCHGAAASTRLHRADPNNARALRYNGHAERALRACASEVRWKAIRAPKPATLRVSGIMRCWETNVQNWRGGHVRANCTRHREVLGDSRKTLESEVGQDSNQNIR